MRSILGLSAVLAVICLVSSGALAVVDSLTRERIARNEALKEEILRAEAVAGVEGAGSVSFPEEPVEDETFGVKFYRAVMDGEFAGTAFTIVTNQGYGGPIAVVTAVDPDGRRLRGVRIKSHLETPGLGANIKQVRYGEKEPWFLAQFVDLGSEALYLSKDNPGGKIDAISGATISSRAVTEAVRNALEDYQERKPSGAPVQQNRSPATHLPGTKGTSEVH